MLFQLILLFLTVSATLAYLLYDYYNNSKCDPQSSGCLVNPYTEDVE